MKLRNYQQSIFNQILTSNTHDLVQLDTGAGKTPIIAQLSRHYKQALIVCHRNVLIKQASEKLAACRLNHRILAAMETKKICAQNNRERYGKHYLSNQSSIILISIDTWHSQFKRERLAFDFNKDYIVLIDEAHHLADNKWKLLQAQVGGRCIGFTATPVRSDGVPLLKKYGGFFDKIVQAEGYRENGTERLIAEGYLAQYQAFIATAQDGTPLAQHIAQIQGVSKLTEYQKNFKNNKIGGKSFINQAQQQIKQDLKERQTLYIAMTATAAYRYFGKNQQAIVIAPRILNALELAENFAQENIKAAIVHSARPQYENQRIIDAFEKKHIKVLIAVDMISEGFDVPDADILILYRKISSFGLYRQICGRVLRPRPNKLAKIIDLTGYNIAKHGLPSDPINWEEKRDERLKNRLVLCHICGYIMTIQEGDYCKNCGASLNVKLAQHAVPYIKNKFYSARMVEKERLALQEEARQRLLKAQKEERMRLLNETYIEITPYFGDGLLAKRTKDFFILLQKYLKKELSPRAYNDFMHKNRNNFIRLSFYADFFSPYVFDKTKAKDCALALYKEKK